LILISFVMAIALGTALLRLPGVAKAGGVSWLDGVFMATSAVCVTGLSLFDIGKDFTFWGQVIILGLMQVGGIGIMTFSLLFALLLGSKTSLSSRFSVAEFSRYFDQGSVKRALIAVLILTGVFEGIGTALLFGRFQRLYPLKQALFQSVFHAVSAFCNAGFSLFSDSLVRFQHDPYVLSVMMGLIICGGLGFMVWKEVLAYGRCLCARQEVFRLSLHTKVALVGTLIFVVGGAAVIWRLEAHNALEDFSVFDQGLHAVFLSVTARTAGFNTMTTAGLSNATLFFVMMLMFIGACPGSTAGGIKIHTFVTLFQLLAAKIRRRVSPTLFFRSISSNTVDKAWAIFALAFITLMVGTLCLQITETIDTAHTASGGEFLDLMFEAGSAFGTVGLSTGVTTHLSAWGKVWIIFLMLAGRIGPMTLGVALFRPRTKEAAFEYVQEDLVLA